MARIADPIQIFHGDADTLIPLSSSQRAAELADEAELVVLPGEGHGFTLDATRQVIDRLAAFVQAQGGGRN